MIVAGVIPCYKTPEKALRVVRQSYNYLDMVICVDDCCPSVPYWSAAETD